jgi:hypothetical protein
VKGTVLSHTVGAKVHGLAGEFETTLHFPFALGLSGASALLAGGPGTSERGGASPRCAPEHCP